MSPRAQNAKTYGRRLVEKSYLTVDPELARIVGLNESIILRQLMYWMNRSKHDVEGHVWVYNTAKEWTEQFPFWGVHGVRRIMGRLRDQGLVLTRRFGASRRDQTLWYTIDLDRLDVVFDEFSAGAEPADPEPDAPLFDHIFEQNPGSSPDAPMWHVVSPAGDTPCHIDVTQRATCMSHDVLHADDTPCHLQVTQRATSLIDSEITTETTSEITNKNTAAAQGRAKPPTEAPPQTAAAAFSSQQGIGKAGGPPPTPPPTVDEPVAQAVADLLAAASFERADALAIARQTRATEAEARDAIARCNALAVAGKLYGTFRGCVKTRLERRYPQQPPPVKAERAAVPDHLREEVAAEAAEVRAAEARDLEFLQAQSPEQIEWARKIAIQEAPTEFVQAMFSRHATADLLSGKCPMLRAAVIAVIKCAPESRPGQEAP